MKGNRTVVSLGILRELSHLKWINRLIRDRIGASPQRLSRDSASPPLGTGWALLGAHGRAPRGAYFLKHVPLLTSVDTAPSTVISQSRGVQAFPRGPGGCSGHTGWTETWPPEERRQRGLWKDPEMPQGYQGGWTANSKVLWRRHPGFQATTVRP